MKINRVGVDLAKNVFQLHGADHRGKAVWKRRLSRGKWLAGLCDWYGSLCWCPLLGQAVSRKRLRGQDRTTAVREAFYQEQQERCQ